MPDIPLFGFFEGSEGAQKLFTAILNRAIRDYSQYLGRDKPEHVQIAMDAWEWLMSDEESRDLTSFVDVCRILDQCPTLVRIKVAELVEYAGSSPTAISVPNAA